VAFRLSSLDLPRRWPEEGPRWPGFWGWPGLHISDITDDVMKSVNSRSKAEATRRQWTTVRRLVIDQEQTKNQVGSGFTSNFKLRVTKTLTMSLSRYVTRTVPHLPSSVFNGRNPSRTFISRCPSDVQTRASSIKARHDTCPRTRTDKTRRKVFRVGDERRER